MTNALQTIALVTPNLNLAPFLEQSLKSVLCQGYPALEYVVVDGGSTDQSLPILRRYEDQLHRLIIEPDAGHADALNKGFRCTSGEIMGWINSDDLLHRNALATVDAVFAAFPEVDWITGRPTTAMGGGGKPTTFQIGRGRSFSRGDLLAGDFMWIQQESTFWRRNLWNRAGGSLDTGVGLAVDFELWLRFSRHAKLYTVDALVGAFRRRGGQRSVVQQNEYMREAESLIAEELKLLNNEGHWTLSRGYSRSRDSRWLRRLLRRVGLPVNSSDISQARVQKALLHRWAQVTNATQPFGLVDGKE